MRRTTPTNVRAQHVKRGDSLTNIAGTVATVEIKDKDVLITMSNGDQCYFGLTATVVVNRPL